MILEKDSWLDWPFFAGFDLDLIVFLLSLKSAYFNLISYCCQPLCVGYGHNPLVLWSTPIVMIRFFEILLISTLFWICFMAIFLLVWPCFHCFCVIKISIFQFDFVLLLATVHGLWIRFPQDFCSVLSRLLDMFMISKGISKSTMKVSTYFHMSAFILQTQKKKGSFGLLS